MAQTEKGIIYPYDYNEVADVPSDFKALAESIDRILSDYSLSTDSGNKIILEMNSTTYKIKAVLKDKDDNVINTSNEIDLPLENMVTNISYDDQKLTLTHQDGHTTEVSIADLISDLASKEEVSELQSQVDDLTTLVETELESNEVEGTEIDVSDSAEYRGRIEVKGNTYQKQLSGKNFYGINDYEGTFKNVTIKIKDGEMTLNGTANGTGTLYIEPKNEQIFDGTYTIVKNLISGTQTGSGNINLRNANDDTVIDGTQLSLGDNIRTFTINNTSIKYGIYLMNGVTFNNFKIRPQIVVGNTPDYDFEPYCGGQASPNPDYPQEIKVVTGDNVVKHVGKNRFKSVIEQGAYATDGSKFTSTVQIRTADFIRIKPNTSYVFSNTNDLVIDRICYYDENYNFIERGEYINNSNFTTLNNNCRYIRFNIKKQNNVSNEIVPSELINPQLEQGSTATPYEEYRGEEYKFDLWKENEFDSENANVLDALLSGSNYTLNSNSHEKTVIVPCLKNTTYKISKKTGQRLRIAEFDENPQIGSTGRNFKINDQGNKLIYFTTGNYLAIGFYFTDVDGRNCTVEEMLNSIQIQEAIELCKIDDYQDILFKNVVGDENYNAELEDVAWYKKSAIAEVVLDGRETWNYNSGNRYFFTNKFLDNYVTQYTKLVSNNYIGGMASNGGLYNNHIQTGTAYSFMLCDNRFTDKNDLKTWLSTHNTIVKYPLATPTYEKITDPNLISQLEALRKAKWFKGVNHWWTETENLEPNLKGTYKQSNNIKNKAKNDEQDERLANLESRLALLE